MNINFLNLPLGLWVLLDFHSTKAGTLIVMKNNFCFKMMAMLILSLGVFSVKAQTLPLPETDLKINGAWKLSGMISEGQKLPVPDPDLDVLYEFSKDNFSRLFWSRKNDRGFCDRKATYKVLGNLLYQKVFWTHPDNLPECVNSPDMQVDHEDANHVDIKEGKLLIDVNINDKTVTYIFDPLTKPTLELLLK